MRAGLSVSVAEHWHQTTLCGWRQECWSWATGEKAVRNRQVGIVEMPVLSLRYTELVKVSKQTQVNPW